MRFIILLLALIVVGCSGMSMKPHKTSVTYGRDNATAEKDAKNDVLTDTRKESWTIKQVFKWE